MAVEDFRALIKDICLLARIENPERFQKEAQLQVDGINFTLLEGAKRDAGAVIYFCDFGLLPNGEERANAIWRLLEMNLAMFGVGAPSFGINHENSHVLLMGAAMLAVIDAEKLLNSFAQYAAQAKRWRENHFLAEPGKNRRKPQPRLPGVFAR